MSLERWSAILSRITAEAPEAVDDIAAAAEAWPDGMGLPAGRELFPALEGLLMPQTAMARGDAVAVGFRVTEPLGDVADRAVRLAAFAIEQDAEVVILSHVDESGFERFGFRVERITGDDDAARAACEDQLRRFWNIDLVL